MKTEQAEILIGLALKRGASHAEFYRKETKGRKVEVKDGRAEAVESSVSSGYSLRIICEGRLGFSYSTDPLKANEVVERALKSSSWAEPDEFLSIPMPGKPEMPEIYDPAVDSIKEKDILEKALLIEGSALSDRRVKRLRNTTASFSVSETSIYNSNGMGLSYKSTACTAHTLAVAEEGGDSQSGWDFQGSRFLGDVSFVGVGRTAGEMAVSLLGAKRITPTKSPVIIANSVAVQFLGVFASLLSSEAVQKGKSLLKGKLAKKVLSENISIIDDGLLPRLLGSMPVDDEGVPVMGKYLIKEGLLHGFMYNTYTARKDNISSTGNGARARFSAMPSVGPMNLYIESKKTVPDLIGALGTGLYITDAMGMHMVNPISGDFSIGVSGLWVTGGKVMFPVKEAVLSGNILKLMDEVIAAGEDLRFYGNIGSPGLLIGPTDISA